MTEAEKVFDEILSSYKSIKEELTEIKTALNSLQRKADNSKVYLDKFAEKLLDE